MASVWFRQEFTQEVCTQNTIRYEREHQQPCGLNMTDALDTTNTLLILMCAHKNPMTLTDAFTKNKNKNQYKENLAAKENYQ